MAHIGHKFTFSRTGRFGIVPLLFHLYAIDRIVDVRARRLVVGIARSGVESVNAWSQAQGDGAYNAPPAINPRFYGGPGLFRRSLTIAYAMEGIRWRRPGVSRM